MSSPSIFDQVTRAGVSLWLDDLSRDRLSGSLRALIESCNVSGVTTNPAIFSAAISSSSLYQNDIKTLATAGLSAESIIESLTTDDVRNACDLFANVFVESEGRDGRVSIEVDPRLARESEETIKQGHSLWQLVDRKNLLIKVPATKEGLPAITALTESGISVNVTLIFSLSRYREVIEAYMSGLERRLAAGSPIDSIHSVASFFVSRVDTEIDARLKAMSDEIFDAHRGRAAVANAVLAYQLYEEMFASPRWQKLQAAGAQIQRPLWASTGVKDPFYRPTLYVDTLIARNTVNTLPEVTLQSITSLPQVKSDAVVTSYQAAHEVVKQLSSLSIDLEEVAQKLEEEGLKKFADPWNSLIENVEKAMTS